jgi:large subunit ribosomal protein L9
MMKIILQKDVKDLGKVGDLVNVASGYARNFLFPRKLAMEATAKSVKQMAHIKMVAESKKKKAIAERKDMLAKMTGITLSFKMSAAPESDKIFGSVTSSDISDRLALMGHQVDKRDIHLEEHIKILGQHKAVVRMGAGLEAEITVSVEREA